MTTFFTGHKHDSLLAKMAVLLLVLVLPPAGMAQTTHKVTGTVSGDGEPLIGALITVDGKSATTTDYDGNFTIALNGNPTIEVSYIGYTPQKLKADGRNHLDIVLEASTIALQEVVAVGYGVQQKKLITGATSHLSGDALVKQATVSSVGALQGMAPGVNVVKNNGKPGEGFKVLIRGAGTMHDTAPLCIIDGQPGDLNSLNPADIESIDILKDAASCAIYGARAANGVILVTTKHPERGRTDISLDAYWGWQTAMTGNANPTSAQDYLMLLEESGLFTAEDFTSDLIPRIDDINSGAWNGTNWIDEFAHKNAPVSNYALNINKGSDNASVNIGLSYTTQKPTMYVPDDEVSAGFDRYTARINSEMALVRRNNRDILKIGEILTMSYSNKRGLDQATSSTTWNDFRNMMKASPLFEAYDADGNFGKPVRLNPDEFNPLAKSYYNSAKKQSKNYGVNATLFFEVSPIADLRWRSSYAVRYSSWSYRGYVPVYDLNGTTEKRERDSTTQQGGMGLGWTIENTINYRLGLESGHNFDFLVGNTVEKNGLGDNFSGTNQGSEFNDFFHAYLGNVKVIEAGHTSLGGSAWGESSLVSVFGRVNYNWRNRYMLTAVVRGDGSSNFAKGHRWGCFPSFSAGWNLTEEPFMEGAKNAGFNYFKLRASWGENGNNKLDAFRYLGTMTLANSANASYYYFGDKTNTPYVGSFIEYPSNTNLTWETSRQTDIGFDLQVLRNRLSANFDYYHKKTVDWLVQTNALGIWGTTYGPWVNGGDIVNQGFEFQLAWNDNAGDFRYGITANMGYNRNRVVRIANNDRYIEGNANILGSGTGSFYRAEEGKPLGYFYGYRHGGIFQNQEEIDSYIDPQTGKAIMPEAKPGDVRFLDLDHDGQITTNDREMIGDPNPDFNYGINVNLQYKWIDLYVSGFGVGGNQIVKAYRNNAVLNTSNFRTSDLERWHGENTSNFLPSLNGSATNWQYVSDLYVEDGDYFRITNITLGVDFAKIFPRTGFKSLRLYLSGLNLFTFTKYTGLDPEVSAYTGAQSWARGIDLGNYPGSRSFMVGVSIKY